MNPHADLLPLLQPDWAPRERATLLFIIKEGRVLLIRKKQGLGAGKINGPGGRLEPGETPREAAVREVQEELCITPGGVSEAGLLRFRFTDGHSIEGTVFTATEYEGTPTETDEAVPLWTPLEAIPYQEMWADDRRWMPHLLAGNYFRGCFLFEGDTMLAEHLEVGTAGTDSCPAAPQSPV